MSKKLSELPTASSISGAELLPILQDGSTVSASASDIVQSNIALGAMAPAVQALIDAAAADNRARANHTGVDAAASIEFSNGQTLETWKTAVETILAGVSASAPVNTVAPTAPTGSLSVGSTLTANQGTWTGASTYAYQWRQTGVAIVGATSGTYVLRSSDAGLFITCTVTATATNGLANSATSPAVGPVTATVPTISVVPAVTPSGTQAVGTLLTTTNGTWTNGTGATYEYQWFVNSSPRSGATASTFTPIVGMEGASIFAEVRATTAQGASAWAASNTVTISSTPAIANTALPAWSGTLYFGVANDFTEATWTGTINAARTWQFFRNAEVTPYVSPPNTLSIHTPRSPAVAGDTLYIEETVTETATGTTYTARSAGAVIQAVPAALALVQAQTGLSWTAGSAITPVQPITATGGTTPYTWSIDITSTPALPSGLSISSSTGVISGTPASAVALATYTVKVVDAAGSPATATATFTATVSAASVTPLSALTTIGEVAIEAGGYDTGYTGQTISTVTSGVNVGDGFIRIRRDTNVLSTGKVGYLRGIKLNDPTSSGSGHRSEFSWYGKTAPFSGGLDHGIDYWWAFAIRPIAWHPDNNNSGDQQIIFQIHQTPADALPGPTFGLKTSGLANNLMLDRVYGAAPTGTEDTPYTGGQDTRPANDVWTRFIIHHRMGDTSASGPVIQIWKNGVQIVNLSGDAARHGQAGYSNYYPKIGFYKWNYASGNYGTPTTREAYYSELYFGIGTNLYSEAEAAIAAFT